MRRSCRGATLRIKPLLGARRYGLLSFSEARVVHLLSHNRPGQRDRIALVQAIQNLHAGLFGSGSRKRKDLFLAALVSVPCTKLSSFRCLASAVRSVCGFAEFTLQIGLASDR